jgi:hypothetical protein
VKIEYRKIWINGAWFVWDERRETEEKFLEEREKKRRRTGEKRYKEKVKVPTERVQMRREELPEE